MVDDDPAVREIISWLLEEEGYRVYMAADGADALRQVGHVEHIDLVLTDVNMPVMDGIELSRRLSVYRPAIPVLLMSGRQNPHPDRAFIAKPFRWDALRSAMCSAIEAAPALCPI